MKLTKKLEAEILKIYHSYWEAYVKGDMKKFASMMDDNITVIGSAVSEVFKNKKETVRFYKATADQLTGKAEFRNRKIRVHPVGDTILINDQCDLYILIDKKWAFYGPVRISALFLNTPDGWKLAHQHGSFPDNRAEEGEQLAAKKIEKENLQLKEAVQRRTIELEQKNRELEVEASLERVRAIAMGMKKPADMLAVCKTISQQMLALGVKHIRNVQTAIFYPQRGTYMNYEYYAKHKKTFITETTYTNNRTHKAFATKMLKGEGEFFTTHIKGKKVKDWLAYQKTTNVFIDKYLKTASSLNYYWYSLGPVAMGISSYVPLSDEHLNLFKRFRNVFELAYRRYLDIERAEAQAREATIEASLEKVRAVAMGMHASADLLNVCETLFKELGKLGFSEMRNAMVNIHNDQKKSFINYDYSDEIGRSSNHLVYDIHPLVEKQIRTIRSADDAFSETYFTGRDLVTWKNFRRSIGEKDDPRLDENKGLYYYFYSIGIGSIGISTFGPINEEKKSLLKRFRNVFALSYQRYADIKKAEAQAREAEIELGLERVRAKTTAMKTQYDLLEVIESFGNQLVSLGFRIDAASFINGVTKTDWDLWVYSPSFDYPPQRVLIPYIETPYFTKTVSNIVEYERSGNPIQDKSFTKEEKNEFLEHYWKHSPPVPDELKTILYATPGSTIIDAFLGDVTVSILKYELEPYSEEQHELFKRFSNVFKQTYTRFLDLQKAETQAREAQIQLALERARTQSMMMQHSDDLNITSQVFHQQLLILGIDTEFTYLWLPDEEKNNHLFWATWPEQQNGSTVYRNKALTYALDKTEPATAECLRAWRSGAQVHTYTVLPSEVENYFATWKELVEGGEKLKPEFFSEGFYYVEAFMKYGCFGLFIRRVFTEEEKKILGRFAIEFERAYTRFLDLQKAEEQAREAKIEAALERVRSRSIGMQKSAELKEVIQVVYEQFIQLNIHIDHAGFVVEYKPKSDWHFWVADQHAVVSQITVPWYENVWGYQFDKAKEKGENFFATHLNFEEKNRFYRGLLALIPDMPDEAKDFYFTCPGLAISTVLMDTVALYIENFSGTPYSEEDNAILLRFGRVFQQTYTRFLDLQKAEAQAREAQIEAALEKVRGKAMAMHSSSDLSGAVSAVFAELRKLGVSSIRTGVALYSKDRSSPVFYAAASSENEGSLTIIGSPDPSSNPCLALQLEAWQKQQNYFPILKGEELKAYYNAIHVQLPKQLSKDRNNEHQEYGYYLPFSEGNFYIWSEKPCTDGDITILNRFKAIIDLTFRRYLELQKAEAQARESQIQASLERVRSRTLAMQKSDELAETAAVLFRQLIALGIAPNRLYIAIIKDENGSTEFWITDEDGSKVSSGFSANLRDHSSFLKMFDGWKRREKSLTIDMQGRELQEYFEHLASLNVPFKRGLSQKRRVQTIAYFSKGFIGIASPDPQPQETTALLERFAAVFNLTFTRFNDLQIAEAHALQAEKDLIAIKEAKQKAEEALSELQATQQQLIQSEKMASLGELTAGIAHEIKNPLNFVNNFSSVSVELLDEAMEELRKSSSGSGDVAQLLTDVKSNLSKIVEHGNRADGIVKSMLQHARSSGGNKAPTDVNALIKEYVNLAFHGMRAGKKPINVKIELDLDHSVGTAPLVAEDFGRVIVNLCQNAFDAMREKLERTGQPYLPALAVRTRRNGQSISIDVEDNGPGVPDEIKDKILQPFFTTKKGNQGTGLGLSITHDIVKAHGGTMTLESSESRGTIFSITIPTNGG